MILFKIYIAYIIQIMAKSIKILAIETSCDETAFALVEASGGLAKPKFKVLENLVSSQIEIHKPFGGVVPNLAKREHLKNLPILFKKLTTKYKLLNTDLLCVTVGPGLEPALWTGINFAKEIKEKTKLIGVSHLEGHLYSILLDSKFDAKKMFPGIALIVSGGHTILILMKDLTHYKILGQTRDDAVGEAFDKAARLLGLPYPGGPEIEKLSKKGKTDAIDFPRPMIHQKNYDFSFSGLKTALLYYLRDNSGQNVQYTGHTTRYKKARKEDVAASFQKAAFDVVIEKTLRAAEEFGAKSIMVSGGVSASRALADEFKKAINSDAQRGRSPDQKRRGNKKAKLLITKFPTDNAVMIAAAGYISHLRKKNRKLAANGNLGL
jgi:N6-L-threonylcarbamoyladenine synthase